MKSDPRSPQRHPCTPLARGGGTERESRWGGDIKNMFDGCFRLSLLRGYKKALYDFGGQSRIREKYHFKIILYGLLCAF